MKRYLYILVFFIPFFSAAQSKYTVAQVEKSTDPQVIANFVKYNPTHPKTPEFKRKLLAVINNDKPAAQQSSVAKPTVKPLSTEKLKTAVKRDVASGGGVSEKNKRTAALLTHMFNTDPRSKDAYIQIVNKSKCNLIVMANFDKIKTWY